MNIGRRIPVASLLSLAFALTLIPDGRATLKFKKETGKKCTFCHTRIPEIGDEDPGLNNEGRRFQENGNRLTEDQRRN